MIVGTAGHIDHGKTTLVRALTGVDTDRLPQEKARGISIELGYAFLDVHDAGTSERIAFVDVPGHERLVHTMISGASGIDVALLVVAADDGVMPQTREHCAVLSLLGISRGVVAISKCDRVDDTRVGEVDAQVRALLARTALVGAPIVALSSRTGYGIAGLRSALDDAARSMPSRPAAGRAFRLAIDRVFTLAGTGTVVTGTVHAGTVAAGMELMLTPSAWGERIRARTVHAQNRAAAQAVAGQRCAVALAGVPKEAVARGQWLVAPEIALQSDRIDVALTLWHEEAAPLRSGMKVHVHVGAGATTGSVAVLGVGGASRDAVQPGQSALVQLVLRQPIAAWRGDRVLLRDASAQRTVAGGMVVDPMAPVRYRGTVERLDELAARAQDDARERLHGLIARARHGVSVAQWLRIEGLGKGAVPELPSDALVACDGAAGSWLLSAPRTATIAASVVASLRAIHASEPDALGPDSGRLRRAAAPRLPLALWKALLEKIRQQGLVATLHGCIHLPEHSERIGATEVRLLRKVAPMLMDDGGEGLWVRDVARSAHEDEAQIRQLMGRMARRGELHQVVHDLYYATVAMRRFAGAARDLADERGLVTAAKFRDATKLGRKRAVQLLEYFDRIGLLAAGRRRAPRAQRLRTVP